MSIETVPVETTNRNYIHDKVRLDACERAVRAFVNGGYVIDGSEENLLPTSVPKRKPEVGAPYPASSSGIISVNQFRSATSLATAVGAMYLFTSQSLVAGEGTSPIPTVAPSASFHEVGVVCSQADGDVLVVFDQIEPPEQIVAHTSRVVTTSEAAREWDAMAKKPSRMMVVLPPD